MRSISFNYIGLFLLAMFCGLHFMTYASEYTQEHELKEKYHNEIATFWQTGTFGNIEGVNKTKLAYASFINASNNKCLVIVPGRTEGYLKYKELSFVLFQQGYDIHIIDHRGQGISQRMQENPYKGYVEVFDFYSDDLHTFIEQVVNPQCKDQYLLAHSMGGAIAGRYLQRFPNNIKAAVLASPMIAINSGPMPEWLAKSVVSIGDTLSQWLSDDSWYFLGQGDYEKSDFEDNRLTQSKLRYQLFNQEYQNQPNLQLGGVTYRWIAEALVANEALFEDIEKLSTPTIVLQAGGDVVVDNQAQNDFCAALHLAHSASCPNGRPLHIADSEHELFFEIDSIRNAAIDAALSWFKRH